MDADPNLAQFFPDADGDVDLYAVLKLTNAASADDIRKAYRKLAMLHHPDKHANASPDRRDAEARTFQQVGFAYAVLSDDKRRARFDSTGRTDDTFELAPGDDGWTAYFAELFDNVTREKLDEMKKEYQGARVRAVALSGGVAHASKKGPTKSAATSSTPTTMPTATLTTS